MLFIDTPFGQVSWHLTAQQMPKLMPDYRDKYDGHTTEEKYMRLAQLVGSGWIA